MKKILLIIALIFLMALNVFAQTGSYTSHDIFYLPLYGAYGTDEYDQYNTYMEIADQLIWGNKTDIEAIEADYLVSADLTDYYTKLEIDAFGYITDAEAVSAIKADEDWNATEWDLAYGWGDHALAGYLTSVALNDLSDVDTTGVADGKIIKYDIATSKWIIADDDDTGTTYTAGTGLDLTGTVFSLDASAFDLSDFPADPDADRYLFWNDTTNTITWAEGSGSGVTTFVGLTDTPLAYTGYAGYFPKVNAGATALEFAELTESDISDFGTYLTDITSESFADLSDIPAHPGVAAKMLETTADGYQYIDTPTGSSGMHITNDLSDGEYSGQTTIGKVGENVEFGDLLYFDFISKTWKLAKADSASTMPCTAIVLEEKDADEDCKILRNGYIMSGDWTFTDSIVYVSPTDEGDVIDSVPDQSGNQIQRIGIAEDDSLLWFSPSLDIGEVK